MIEVLLQYKGGRHLVDQMFISSLFPGRNRPVYNFSGVSAAVRFIRQYNGTFRKLFLKFSDKIPDGCMMSGWCTSIRHKRFTNDHFAYVFPAKIICQIVK